MSNNEAKPLVSVIIRTIGKLEVIDRALDSICEQTYKNIEVVVVEDGKNTIESALRQKFPQLNICYICTGVRKGRSYVGNIGLSRATGQYINFLDDDDYFLPSHIETLVNAMKQKEELACYSVAREIQIKKTAKGEYRECRELIRYQQPFNRLLLCRYNYIPIQSIMFDRSLYQECGGLDEMLDALEDWDLWVRYALKTDFIFVNKITSVYHTPYEWRKKGKRKDNFRNAEQILEKKFSSYRYEGTVQEFYRDVKEIVKIYKYGWVKRYIKTLIGRIVYGE